ncbi:hypothetical protein [Yoonia litorea]|nr:hypothetical protein [Yoonia litorea]
MSKGEKAYAVAYAIVVSVAAGLTMYVMAGVESVDALPAGQSFYSVWTLISGVIGGALALYAARGWLGERGTFGWMRALVGGTAAALIAAVIAGTLISPVYGTFYAPVMLATEFMENPTIGLGWYAAILVAHHLMSSLRYEGETWDYPAQDDEPHEVTSPLSSLSRANLYHQRD